MKLNSFVFPTPVMVDSSKPVHGVFIGRDEVTSIDLDGGCLIVSKASEVWFVVTSFGVGVPLPGTRDDVLQNMVASGALHPEQARTLKQRSKKS